MRDTSSPATPALGLVWCIRRFVRSVRTAAAAHFFVGLGDPRLQLKFPDELVVHVYPSEEAGV